MVAAAMLHGGWGETGATYMIDPKPVRDLPSAPSGPINRPVGLLPTKGVIGEPSATPLQMPSDTPLHDLTSAEAASTKPKKPLAWNVVARGKGKKAKATLPLPAKDGKPSAPTNAPTAPPSIKPGPQSLQTHKAPDAVK